MKVSFLEVARRELDEAAAYYELEFEGLGTRFMEEVRLAALRIQRNPLAWSIELDEVRKCLLHKFPHKLLYVVDDQLILIVAVAHQHREPEYWVDRMLSK